MSDTNKTIEISLVIPAYNEAEGLEALLPELTQVAKDEDWEIIVVDDGSTDGTADVVRKFEQCVLVKQPTNKGNGASLKAGVRAAKGEYVVTLDADGQHRADEIKKLIANRHRYDMITGVRGKSSYKDPVRAPGKWVLTAFGEWVSGEDIQDINCGFRVYRKERFMEFIHLYPNGFSQPTTSMVGFLKAGYNVGYEPITGQKRTGRKSTVKYFRDGFKTLLIILRIAHLFDPLRIFLPLALLFGLTGVAFCAVEIFSGEFPSLGLFTIISGVLLFSFGMLADMISAIRQGQRSSGDD